MCAKRKTGDKKHILFSDEFYSDINEKDMLHAILVRSQFSSGKILSVTFNPKTPLPEQYGILTAQDFGRKNKIQILGAEIPILAEESISYQGEPIAVLYGKDKNLLEELKNYVKIRVEESQNTEETKSEVMLTDNETSQNDGFFASLRMTMAEKNLLVGNPDEFFENSEKSAYIIEGKWSNQSEYKQNQETEGAFAQIKAGNLHIFTPSQWISQTLKTVCFLTEFPKEKIFITQTKISSQSTSSLYQNGILAAIASVIALKTEKPVKLSLSRIEQENFIENTGKISIKHKTAVDANATISAMEISIDYNCGAYNPFADYVLERLVIASPGIYSCKNIKISARARKTHDSPASHPLFAIDSAAFFAIENQIQKIAGITGFSPVEFRQINKAGGLRKITKPFTFSFGRSTDAINAVAIRSDFKRKYTVSRLAEHSQFETMNKSSFAPPFRGIALSCAFEGSGFLGSDFEKSSISLQVSVTEEKKIVVHAIPQSSTIKEIWTKIIQENIEIEKRNILFTSGLFEESLKKNISVQIPEKLLGDVSIKTALLRKCVDSIKRKKIDGTAFSVKKSIPLSFKKSWNQEEFLGTPFYNTAFGTCTVELELDPCTFSEKLCKICVIIDGGKILNPKAAENAVYRSIQQSLSNLVDFTPQFCPSITIQFAQSEDEPKQIGNLVHSILPAAYTAALSQAISCSVDCLPIQTDTIFRLMQESETEKNQEIEDER